ncbi:MAG TPA: NAD-dependent epimerase/dehydratase family protein [Acidimicrobiia bacterium]|nr:NAD-dependent epimerase/dehydratase family protein [Acidimicrobiia bacterium]
MRALVTGSAGFIGSTLGERLLEAGHEVLGIDALTSSYDPVVKRGNLEASFAHSAFTFVEDDLTALDLARVLREVDVVFHMAALPGSRDSWGRDFAAYEQANVLATQRLLEAGREQSIQRFVYSSSSSVYGSAARFPVSESDLPHPITPYGVTKLAGEHLCRLYAYNFGIPTLSLRYFSVYGPRQRPDMAIHRVIDAGLSGRQFSVLGDGEQRRDFTFVDDVVDANVRAIDADLEPGTVVNIGTGTSTSLNRVIEIVADVLGRGITCCGDDSVPGDPQRTEADVTLAAELLGWKPRTSLDSGIRAQVEDQSRARNRTPL